MTKHISHTTYYDTETPHPNSQTSSLLAIARPKPSRYIHLSRRIPTRIRNLSSNIPPKIAPILPRLAITDSRKAQIPRIQHTRKLIAIVRRARPSDRARDIESFLIVVRIACLGVGGQVALIRLRVRAESGDEREGDIEAEDGEIKVQIVEGGKQVRGVQSGGDAVLQVIILACVRVAEVADVAREAGVVDVIFHAGALGGVV